MSFSQQRRKKKGNRLANTGLTDARLQTHNEHYKIILLLIILIDLQLQLKKNKTAAWIQLKILQISFTGKTKVMEL